MPLVSQVPIFQLCQMCSRHLWFPWCPRCIASCVQGAQGTLGFTGAPGTCGAQGFPGTRGLRVPVVPQDTIDVQMSEVPQVVPVMPQVPYHHLNKYRMVGNFRGRKLSRICAVPRKFFSANFWGRGTRAHALCQCPHPYRLVRLFHESEIFIFADS